MKNPCKQKTTLQISKVINSVKARTKPYFYFIHIT